MFGPWRMWPLSLMVGLAGLAGCQEPAVDTKQPAVPLPTYAVGDRFTYDNGRTEHVVSVDGDWVAWRRGNGYRWTGHRDFVTPNRKWESRTRSGNLETLTMRPGEIWPLQAGRGVWFTYATRSVAKDGVDDKLYVYHWRCSVRATETVTVPAGTFDTTPISCLRHSNVTGKYFGERTWYYAPRVGHYVLYTDTSTSRATRTRALTSFRLKLPKLTALQRTFYNNELQSVLQTVPSGSAHRGSKNGFAVTITPIRTYKIASGRFCREYRRIIGLDGRDYRANGTLCKAADGRWRRLSEIR